MPVRGNNVQKAGDIEKHGMFEAFQIFVISLLSSAKEEVKERELSRAQIRKGTECHANQHGLFSDN